MNNIVFIDGKKYLVTFTEINDDDEFITIKEASTMYNLKPTKLYNMIRLKQFPDGIVVKERGTATKFNRKLFCEYVEKAV
jgi:predicted DNA-binding transcriptional regulator AlpA